MNEPTAILSNEARTRPQQQDARLVGVESAAIAEEVASLIRHDLRNKLAVVRNAGAYIKRRLSRSDVWASDPRLESFSALLETEIAAAHDLLSERMNLGNIFARSVSCVDAAACVARAASWARIGEGALDAEAEHGDVVVDLHELALAIRCLVENAAEASDARVIVRASVNERRYVVAVEDTGPGILDDRLEEALRPFSSTKPGHAGLGLNIAKRIAARYRGAVTFSRAPGGRFVAAIAIPLADTPEVTP